MNKLAVGCGVKRIEGVSTYLDLYPDNSKERRAKPGKIIVPNGAIFVKGDVQKMHMFKNKEFDYVYCENVIEHVEYPEAACKELIRVAKEGVITCPTIFGEVFFGWEYHRWLVIDRDEELYFFSKRNAEHIPFGRFFREKIGKNKKYDGCIIPEIKRVFDSNKRIFDVKFEWRTEFRYHVIREKL